jgi:hypothetical protein
MQQSLCRRFEITKITGDSLFMDAIKIAKMACDHGGVIYGSFTRLLTKRSCDFNYGGNVNTINIIFPTIQSAKNYIDLMGYSLTQEGDRYIWKNIIEVVIRTNLSESELRFDIDCLFGHISETHLKIETISPYNIDDICDSVIQNKANILHCHLVKCKDNSILINNLNSLSKIGWRLTFNDNILPLLTREVIVNLLCQDSNYPLIF